MNGEQVIGEPLGGPADFTTGVSFSPAGKWLVVGRRRRHDRVRHGDAATDPPVRRRFVVTAVASAARGLIAVGTIDGQVRFFDRRSGAAVGSALDNAGLRGLASRLQPGRPAARGGAGSEWRRRVPRPAAGGRGTALGCGFPTSRGACDCSWRWVGARPSPSTGRAPCLRPAATSGDWICGTRAPTPPTASRCGWRMMAS